jgi:hypothetical protein
MNGIDRREIETQAPKHSRQILRTGCMQHSFFALTNAKEVLNHQEEGSLQRFLLRTGRLGYLVWPIYCNRYEVASSDFWRRLKDDLSVRNGLRLLCCVGSPGELHFVGLLANFASDQIEIFDPMRDSSMMVRFDEFLRLKFYRDAFEIHCIDSGIIDEYPVQDEAHG